MAKFNVDELRRKTGYTNTSTEDLLKIYRKAAKVADQRLLRLERLSEEKYFKGVKKYAYRKATYTAAEWGGNPAKPRFNIEPPLTSEGKVNRTQIKAKIMDILNFLDKPTSTKQGIINIYQKRADTLNERFSTKEHDLKFTWQDVGDFFESNMYKKAEQGLGSGSVVKAFAAIQDNKEEVLKAFKKKQEYHLKVDDIEVDYAIEKLLSEYKKETRQLLRKIK